MDDERIADRPIPEGKFMPVVMALNTISDIPTDDHKALVIRLELGYVDYANMEDLLDLGLAKLEDRVNDLRKLEEAISKGETDVGPLTLDDVRFARQRASDAVFRAAAIIKGVKRPPPQR